MFPVPRISASQGYVSVNSSDGQIASQIPPSYRSATDKDHALDHVEPKSVEGSAPLHYARWLWVLVLPYTMSAAFAWIVLVTLTFRPVTTAHYDSFNMTAAQWLESDHNRVGFIESFYVTNQHWLQAVRTIQSIVTVLTIPLTSTVCSYAAVVYTQGKGKRGGLSLRQTINLANHSWAAPVMYAKLCTRRFRRHVSWLLLIAIALNVLGGLISPLQSIFVRTATEKTPTSPSWVSSITDIPALVYASGPESDYDRVSLLTRSALTTATSSDPQSRLWAREAPVCDALTICNGTGYNLGQLSQLDDPFLAQMPSGFSTGLVRQWIPRVNSTATRRNVTEAEFPVGCESLPGAFYAEYSYTNNMETGSPFFSWSVVVCMPSNQSSSPWQATRARQDISENLFLNVTLDGTVTSYQVTLNTTVGYFELPNYSNGGSPGPLLEADPWGCPKYSGLGDDFAEVCQTFNETGGLEIGQYRRAPDTSSAEVSNSSLMLQGLSNKGPLLNVVMALFGAGSFISELTQSPERDQGPDQAYNYCVSLEPLLGLITMDEVPVIINEFGDCLVKGVDFRQSVPDWLISLTEDYGGSPDIITSAFEAAAFLANEAWLTDSMFQHQLSGQLTISLDLGADTEIPVISKRGIILISILLSVYIIGLLSLTLYCASRPVWTNGLDAFAMMRIGSALSSKLPLNYVRNIDDLAILDDLPGWIGDATRGEGDVGELGVGAGSPLRRDRQMRCFERH